MKALSKGRKVGKNGDGTFRVTIPQSVAKAAGILLGDIVVVDVPKEGLLQKEIRIKKYVAPIRLDFDSG